MGRQIVVLGMHRSGTSVVTHLLHQMGAYFGKIEDELRPSGENPKGFWERNDVLEINESILKSFPGNQSWYRISQIDSLGHELEPDLDKRIKDLISTLDKKSIWVVKDPRFCFTFRYWVKHLSDPVVVFAYRSPLAVAKSLRNRNNFPLEYSKALCLEYILAALKVTKDYSIIPIEYEKLVEDPIASTHELFEELLKLKVVGLELPSVPTILSLIDPNLKNYNTDSEEENNNLTEAEIALFSALRSNKLEVLDEILRQIEDQGYKGILHNWEEKIEDLITRNEDKQKRIFSTLFSSEEENNYSLQNSIRISESMDSNPNQFTFIIPNSFRLEKFWRIDLIDDISIIQIERVSFQRGTQVISIELEEVKSNAFYRIENWYLFDRIPSSIYFQIEKSKIPESLDRLIIVFNIVGKGEKVLSHINRFHENFSGIYEKNGKNEIISYESTLSSLLDAYTYKSIRYNLEFQSLRKSFEQLVKAQKELRSTIEQQNQVIEKLSRQLSEKDQTLLNAQRDLQEKEIILIDRKWEGKYKSKQIENLKLDIEEQKNKISELQQSILIKEQELAALRESASIIKEDRESLLKQINTFSSELLQLIQNEENLSFLKKSGIHDLNDLEPLEQAEGLLEYLDFIKLLIGKLKEGNPSEGFQDKFLSELAKEKEHSQTLGRQVQYLHNELDRKNYHASNLERDLSDIQQSVSYQIGHGITLPMRALFDFFTKKKPFNQTQLWWIKQYLIHPRVLFGSKSEREQLKSSWKNQRQETAQAFNGLDSQFGDSHSQKAILPTVSPIVRKKAGQDPQIEWNTEYDNSFHFRKKVLYVSPMLPDFDTSSGGKRATRMLGLLAEEFDVYAFTLGKRPQKYIDKLESMGVIVIKTSSHREVRKKLSDISIIIFAWYETFFSSDIFISLYPDARIILDSVDVHWVREERSIGIWEGLTEEKVQENKAREKEAYQMADIIWAVTEDDKNAILKELPDADVRVVSNIHEPAINEYIDTGNKNILFIGGYNHYPNVSAAIVLAKDIFPKVVQFIPEARLILAGSHAPEDVSELGKRPGIEFRGFIEEDKIPSLYQDAAISVSPLLAGAGIKGKICESIAYMTPVVTNDIGNEGINLKHEEEGLIGQISEMPSLIRRALNREYDLSSMTEKAQKKLFGLVGKDVVKRRMVNSILPQVSICIVTWNRMDLLKRCIESIEGNTIYPNYKILVHSNGCTDGTQAYLQAAANINPKIIPILSDKNDVFVLPNNWMMKMYPENDVVLVNNDVYVTKGWLKALYETAYSSEEYGIVGSKILYPDGRLQEFGSELYADGTGRNIGKFDNPNKDEYKQQTEVGYVSGCSMYIKRSTIKRIGVFDEQFHPCYCEDSDYCYTAKEHNLKTVVTPNSVIFHDEGGTSGTDTSSGMKRYQVVNMEKFLKKHEGRDNGIDWGKEYKNSDQKPEKQEYKVDYYDVGGVKIYVQESFEEYKGYKQKMEEEYSKRIKIENDLVLQNKGIANGIDPFTGNQDEFIFPSSTQGRLNFRESFVSKTNHLNSRLRATGILVDFLVENHLGGKKNIKIYLTEQKTPFYNFIKNRYSNVVGSEYLNPEFKSGVVNQEGVRHEDLTSLSFPDNQFDLIVCLEVLEHVPDYSKAIEEVSRVLKKGGLFIFSVPFILDNHETITRALVNEEGKVKHLLEPEYHGDPVNEQGILCYYHFGWDLINETLRKYGLAGSAYFLWSQQYFILGRDICLFVGEKK